MRPAISRLKIDTVRVSQHGLLLDPAQQVPPYLQLSMLLETLDPIPPPTPTMDPLVLLVDDDRVTRQWLRHLVAGEGYRVVEAIDGEECLRLFQQLQPDIILLDAIMPVMDGFACCSHLKALPNSHNTPVLMITGLEDSVSVDRAFAAGAADYVTKPIHWAVLRQRMQRLLQASRTLETLQQQNRQEQLLSTITAHIRQSLDLNDILTTTVQEVRQFLQADSVLICRKWPQGSPLVIAEAHQAEHPSLLQTSLNREWCQQLLPHLQAGRSYALPDLFQSPLADIPFSPIAPPIKSLLCFPFMQGEEFWGLLVVHHYLHPRHWHSWQMHFLENLGSQVESAIQQSQLYQHSQQQAQRERALNQVIQAIRNSLHLEDIFSTAVAAISQILHVDQVIIAQYLPEQAVWINRADYRRHHSHLDELGSILPDQPHPITQHLKRFEIVTLLAAEASLPSLASGSNESMTFIQQTGSQPSPHWLMDKARTSLFVPLSLSSQIPQPISESNPTTFWGYLALASENLSAQWLNSEKVLVEAIADQLAIAIQQGQLFGQIQTLNQDLEAKVQDRTAQLNAQVIELRRLDALKNDFLSTVSHELRTPLSSIRMAIQLLTSLLHPQVTHLQDAAKITRYLQILQEECEREIRLINDLLDLQRLEANPDPQQFQQMDLQSWIPTVIKPFYDRAQSRQQTLTVELSQNLPQIYALPLGLEQILSELLNNACKYTPPHEDIFVQVTANRQHLMIVVRNTGVEIPSRELPHIFEKFYRVPNADPWRQGGTGLGLALVQQRVSLLDGSIAVESENNQTTFTVRIPFHLDSEVAC
ncbi:MAG: response regulator [Cyanobacteriota bacterium]|nr:response regulator [Cyanobacteriota bacterium]